MNLKLGLRLMVIALFVLLSASFAVANTAKTIDDSDALQGVRSAKGIFDINVSDAKKLELYLTVIQRTYDDLVRQGQKADLVIAFRGASVRLISTEIWSFSDEDQESLKRSSVLLTRLKGLGVKLEACSVATELFKIDKSTILPEVHVVGNTFISLIGYQARGYALVPIQ